MNNYEGQRLVPRIAEQLIIELFAGQTIQTQEIKIKVEEVHAERGGSPYTSKYHPAKIALTKMKKTGLAENPQRGYWSIHSSEDTCIKTLDGFMKWVSDLYEDEEDEREFVFRGVTNEEYPIQASAVLRPDEKEQTDKKKRRFDKFLYINKDLIRKAKQRGYDKKDGTELNDLDILAELQHYGAATCLIDFTYSAQIALWFACQPHRKKQEEHKDKEKEPEDSKKPVNGKVYAVHIKPPKFTEITPEFMAKDTEQKKDIGYFLKEGNDAQLYYLQPKLQNHRIIAQQSVFLFGQYEFKEDDYCVIDTACKEKILKELHRVSSITDDKLFPDFEGFAWVHRKESPYTEPTPSALKARGRSVFDSESFDSKSYNDAIEDFSRAIEKDSNDVEAYNLRGRAYTRQKNYDDALKDFKKAIDLNQDYAEAFFSRGELYGQREQYEEALIDFDQAINLNPDYDDAYNRRGGVKYNLGLYEEALADFNETIRLKPNSASAYYWRGIMRYFVNRNHEDAFADLDEAIRLKPDYDEAYYSRGFIKHSLHQYNPAILDFDIAINLDPNSVNSLYYRAEAKVHLDRFPEAEQDLEFALDLALQDNNDELVRKIIILLNEIDTRIATEAEDE
jgi:tetratricopeptide (TPR) repeat protein